LQAKVKANISAVMFWKEAIGTLARTPAEKLADGRRLSDGPTGAARLAI